MKNIHIQYQRDTGIQIHKRCIDNDPELEDYLEWLEDYVEQLQQKSNKDEF